MIVDDQQRRYAFLGHQLSRIRCVCTAGQRNRIASDQSVDGGRQQVVGVFTARHNVPQSGVILDGKYVCEVIEVVEELKKYLLRHQVDQRVFQGAYRKTFSTKP